MFCIDGNNSLKRLAPLGNRHRGDTRVFEQSDYYLSENFVNGFAHEVKARRGGPGNEEGQVSNEGDPTDDAAYDDPASTPSPCTTNWKAAAAEDKKRMWNIFDETGIFASACPHGFILWITDMVRSGEL